MAKTPATRPTDDPTDVQAAIAEHIATIESLKRQIETLSDVPGGNRFLHLFPLNLIRFKMKVKTPNAPWSDGTVTQDIAEAILMAAIGNGHPTGATVTARVQIKTLPGKLGTRLDMQMPTSGSAAFKFPMLSVREDEGATADMEEFRKLVVQAWIEDRRRLVSSGLATSVSGLTPTTGVTLDDSLLTALGVVIPDDKKERPAPTTKATDTPAATT